MTIKQSTTTKKRNSSSERPVYPFAAMVGQEELKLGLMLNVIDPLIGGVLIMGHRGTGKSTAVRGLADLLPESWVVKDCVYRCDPAEERNACESCRSRFTTSEKLERERSPVPVVDLPLGATEDRVCGSIDIQRALSEGIKAFEPGLLARANRGFLYIDEVNLLEDHLVDLLLDVAVTGRNKVERESMSVEHPARFVLIGSGNPEEGELRPQLLDRFGLHVEVKTEDNLDDRVEVVERREAYERDPEAFYKKLETEQLHLRQRITKAQKHVGNVQVDRSMLRRIAQLCSDLQIDGHRGELTITRAARSLAAFEGRKKVSGADVRRIAPMALRHRLRRDPLEETASSERIQNVLSTLFPEVQPDRKGKWGGGGDSGAPETSKQQSVQRDTVSQRRRTASAPGGNNSSGEVIPVPNQEKNLLHSLPLDEHSRKSANRSTNRDSPTRGDAGNRNRSQLRGRYVRATPNHKSGARLAVDATLRAIAGERVQGLRVSEQWLHGSTEALRFKELSHKSGRLFIFAVDTSGSMAWHRIGQTKAAVINLLKQSYIRRDSVAIVGFRGNAAEVLLPPSRSILRARRALETLRVGGGTPLSAGLACALKLAKGARRTTGEITVSLFTDGHANVVANGQQPYDRDTRRVLIERELTVLGREFAKANVRLVVVDTQNKFAAGREAVSMAERLSAEYTRLPRKSEENFGAVATEFRSVRLIPD